MAATSLRHPCRQDEKALPVIGLEAQNQLDCLAYLCGLVTAAQTTKEPCHTDAAIC